MPRYFYTLITNHIIMTVIATDKNKITLIYNSNTPLGKQMQGYVNSAKKEIMEVDLCKTSLTGTQWIEIADKLGKEVDDLINKEHPDFANDYPKDASLEVNDWLKVINKNPKVIFGSILIIGQEYHHLINPSDFVKHIESDSAGVSRNPAE